MNFVAIDFETATYSPESACAVGLVRVEQGKIVRQEAYLIRTPTPEFRFTWVHGITWPQVMASPTFGELWPKIADFFYNVEFAAAHNAGFDQRVLRACCERYGIAAPPISFECSMIMARSVWNLFPTKLPDVCRHLGVALNHHDALSDAHACAQIMIAGHAEMRRKARESRLSVDL